MLNQSVKNLHSRNVMGCSDNMCHVSVITSRRRQFHFICQDFLEGGLQEGQTIKFTETEAEEEGVTGPPPTPMVGVAVVEGPLMLPPLPHMMRDHLMTTEL